MIGTIHAFCRLEFFIAIDRSHSFHIFELKSPSTSRPEKEHKAHLNLSTFAEKQGLGESEFSVSVIRQRKIHKSIFGSKGSKRDTFD